MTYGKVLQSNAGSLWFFLAACLFFWDVLLHLHLLKVSEGIKSPWQNHLVGKQGLISEGWSCTFGSASITEPVDWPAIEWEPSPMPHVTATESRAAWDKVRIY
jgi:hypothetical protein